jgi:hypothetical protein
MLTVVVFGGADPEVDVTVTLEAPFCVEAVWVAQPTSPAVVITSNASVK